MGVGEDDTKIAATGNRDIDCLLHDIELQKI